MKEFKIRCSSIVDIMTEPREKTIYSVGGKEITTAKYNKIVDSVLSSGDISLIQHVEITKEYPESGLSTGAITHCKDWVKQNMFGRYNNISTKYTEKGIECEEQGLNLIVKSLGLKMIYKNEERKSDDYKTGECDFIHNGIIYDNKCSYSFDTYPMFDYKLSPRYQAQMQGYMSLWELNKSVVCHTLVDTPIEILTSEIKWLSDDDAKQTKALNHLFTKKAFIEAKEKLFPMAKKIDFIELKDEQRVKVFEVRRDDVFINNIHVNVKKCRDYIDRLLDYGKR